MSATPHKGRAKIRPATDALLLPYQAKWVLDNSRLKIAEKSRQIGWTWATAYSIVRRTSLKDARTDVWISSRDDLQARLFLEDCKAFSSLLSLGAQDLGERVIDDKNNTAYVQQFANGKRIHSMSSNPDAQAGKRGSRVLDEFAVHPDPRKLYSIAYYGITWGGQMEIFSTHRGGGNFFNSLITEVKHKGNPKGFSLHRVTLQDALDQGFLFKLQQKLPDDDPRLQMDEAEYFNMVKAESPDNETFLQECMCVPADESSAFITYEMLDSVKYAPNVTWDLPWDELEKTNNLYLGVDVGRVQDLTVFWLIHNVGGINLTAKLVTMRNATFDAQEDVFYRLLNLRGLVRACVDQTGIGRQFTERAQTRYGAYRVEGVTFTAPVKESLAYPVRAAMEDRSIRIPDDRDVFADFRSIKKEATSAGNIRFAADRGANGHADRFWALALALHAAKGSGPISVHPAPLSSFNVADPWSGGGSSNRMRMRPDDPEEAISLLNV